MFGYNLSPILKDFKPRTLKCKQTGLPDSLAEGFLNRLFEVGELHDHPFQEITPLPLIPATTLVSKMMTVGRSNIASSFPLHTGIQKTHTYTVVTFNDKSVVIARLFPSEDGDQYALLPIPLFLSSLKSIDGVQDEVEAWFARLQRFPIASDPRSPNRPDSSLMPFWMDLPLATHHEIAPFAEIIRPLAASILTIVNYLEGKNERSSIFLEPSRLLRDGSQTGVSLSVKGVGEKAEAFLAEISELLNHPDFPADTSQLVSQERDRFQSGSANGCAPTQRGPALWSLQATLEGPITAHAVMEARGRLRASALLTG